MNVDSLYQSKLTTADRAVTSIPSGSRLSMGMFAAEPPALLKALADRGAAVRSRISDSTISRRHRSLATPYCATNSTIASNPIACL